MRGVWCAVGWFGLVAVNVRLALGLPDALVLRCPRS
jgi:hypothetical protein